jgi:hypothetical protein
VHVVLPEVGSVRAPAGVAPLEVPKLKFRAAPSEIPR